MKILLLTSYFYPEKSASVYLNKNRNESFIKSNFNIEIYTPYPTRGVSEHVRKEYINKKSEVLYGGQMLIHRFALFREGRSSILRAIRYFLCCCIQFFKGCMAKDVNMMFISSTPPIQGAMAALIKKVRGFPIVYNLQDIFPDSLVSTGLTKKGSFLWKIGRIIEDFTYRNADKIVVISEDFKKNIMAKGVPEDKITVIYNWVEEDKVFPVSRDENKLFNELGLEKFLFYVVYAGNLGYAQNIRVLIDAASLLSDYKDVQFVIFGQKNKINEYNEIINRLNLNNVKLFHLQDYSRVSSVYSLGDIDIVSCKAGFGGVGVPSKTWSIMSAARPVIASFDEESELCSIIRRSESGLCVPPDDPQALKNAILELYFDKEKRIKFGKNGREFVLKNLTREAGTTKYVQVVREVFEKSSY